MYLRLVIIFTGSQVLVIKMIMSRLNEVADKIFQYCFSKKENENTFLCFFIETYTNPRFVDCRPRDRTGTSAWAGMHKRRLQGFKIWDDVFCINFYSPYPVRNYK